MNLPEAAKLLAFIAAYDRRKAGEADDLAWSTTMTNAGIDVDEACTAVAQHFTESTDWLMPAHVVKLARVARARRNAEIGYPDYPSGLSQVQERRWRAAWLTAIRAGERPEDAVTLADRSQQVQRGVLKPRPVRELIEGRRR